MPQSPNVLIATGIGHIPEQDYANIFTKYNLGESDAEFYNRIAQIKSVKDVMEGKEMTPSDPSQHYEFDIYGFMPGNCKYTYKHSIRQIVNFFQRDEKIEVVVCDIMNENDAYNNHQYIHPGSKDINIPFFIKSSVTDKIKFTNEDLIFQNQLNILQSNHIIFHIAEPLISTTIIQEDNE